MKCPDSGHLINEWQNLGMTLHYLLTKQTTTKFPQKLDIKQKNVAKILGLPFIPHITSKRSGKNFEF
jgi:hypothetical protein